MADGINPIANLLGKVDANNALLVAFSGGTASINGLTVDTLTFNISDPNIVLSQSVANRLLLGGTFAVLQFGGATAAFPALRQDTAFLDVVLADVSAYADLRAKSLTVQDAAFLLKSGVAFTNHAAAAAGTLTNAPVAGNPTKWIAIEDNGVLRRIPAW